MASSSEIRIKNLADLKGTTQGKIREDESKLPLQTLKRMLGAMMNDESQDARLKALGEDPDDLRKKWTFMMEQYNGSVYNKYERDVSTYAKIVMKDKEVVSFMLEYDSDEKGGDYYYPDNSTYTGYYVTISFKDEVPQIRLIEAIWREGNEWIKDVGFQRVDDTRTFRVLDTDINVYQVIAMYPKLIEQMLLIYGSYEDILKMLKRVS